MTEVIESLPLRTEEFEVILDLPGVASVVRIGDTFEVAISETVLKTTYAHFVPAGCEATGLEITDHGPLGSGEREYVIAYTRPRSGSL